MTTVEPVDLAPHAVGAAEIPAVRMAITAHLAARLAQHLLDIRGTPREETLCEQLWLRAVLVEQRRRTVMVERASFDAQADRLLAALDPPRRGLMDRSR